LLAAGGRGATRVGRQNSDLQLHWHTKARYSRVRLPNFPGKPTCHGFVIV